MIAAFLIGARARSSSLDQKHLAEKALDALLLAWEPPGRDRCFEFRAAIERRDGEGIIRGEEISCPKQVRSLFFLLKDS